MSWQPFKMGQWCYPFSVCCSAGCDWSVVTGKPPRIDPGSSLSQFHLRFSAWSRSRAQTEIAQPCFVQIFSGAQSTMRCRLAAPWGAPCWLLAALLWFYPSAVWHSWAPAEPPWVSLGLRQPSPAEKVAEFVHPDGESDGTGSSTRSQGENEQHSERTL